MEADEQAVAASAAAALVDALSSAIAAKGRAVFMPSAGRTPIPVYAALLERYRSALDWTKLSVLQMDEYAGVSCSNQASLWRAVQTSLIAPLGIEEGVSINDESGRLRRSPAAYDGLLDSWGGLDVVLLGVGRNGHIGFNEPGADTGAASGLRPLARETLEDNFGDGPRPAGFDGTGFTVGLGQLLPARAALLCATGPRKHLALRRLVDGPTGADCPVSLLRTHAGLSVFADEAAYHGGSTLEGR